MGLQTGTATMEKGVEILQKTNNRVAIWPEIPGQKYNSKRYTH